MPSCLQPVLTTQPVYHASKCQHTINTKPAKPQIHTQRKLQKQIHFIKLKVAKHQNPKLDQATLYGYLDSLYYKLYASFQNSGRMTRDMVDHIIDSNLLALGFDFEEDLDGFQILVRYNVRAHSGSCSIRNFRSVPFSGHCGECRRPLRHTEARPNDHLFLEIIFKKKLYLFYNANPNLMIIL